MQLELKKLTKNQRLQLVCGYTGYAAGARQRVRRTCKFRAASFALGAKNYIRKRNAAGGRSIRWAGKLNTPFKENKKFKVFFKKVVRSSTLKNQKKGF